MLFVDFATEVARRTRLFQVDQSTVSLELFLVMIGMDAKLTLNRTDLFTAW